MKRKREKKKPCLRDHSRGNLRCELVDRTEMFLELIYRQERERYQMYTYIYNSTKEESTEEFHDGNDEKKAQVEKPRIESKYWKFVVRQTRRDPRHHSQAVKREAKACISNSCPTPQSSAPGPKITSQTSAPETSRGPSRSISGWSS